MIEYKKNGAIAYIVPFCNLISQIDPPSILGHVIFHYEGIPFVISF